jgi:hypothetical protein
MKKDYLSTNSLYVKFTEYKLKVSHYHHFVIVELQQIIGNVMCKYFMMCVSTSFHMPHSRCS